MLAVCTTAIKNSLPQSNFVYLNFQKPKTQKMPPSSTFFHTGPVSVTQFLEATREDMESRGGGGGGGNTLAGFPDIMPSCRLRMHNADEAMDSDREGLQKLKKSVKNIGNTGSALSISEAEFAQCLKNLGEMALQNDDDQPEALGKGFINFAGLMDAIQKHSRAMYQTFTNLFLYPLETLLKNESVASKGDLKKAIDKAWKDYEVKSTKVEKEKKQSSKETGLTKNDYVAPAELADELLEERRMFQLQMCECLIKENDIRTRKGVDLLSHLIEYYYALFGFFEDSMKTLKDYQSFIHDISAKAQEIKSRQEEEKKQLYEMRKVLKGGSNAHILREKTASTTNLAAPVTNGSSSHTGYNLHQLQGNKAHGTNRKGILYKKCESKMRRKPWQKRKCEVKDGFLSVAHSDESKSPVKLNLLTCQAKVVSDDKRCFDLVSKFRTYHFQAEDENDKDVWLSVILNSKEEVLQDAFGRRESHFSTNTHETRDNLIKQVQKLPGNSRCCDCDADRETSPDKSDPTWLSTNFGILTCIECSGVHREMGVHISRVQSLTLDNLGTAQLILARTMTNLLFNQIFEGSVNNVKKPTSHSTMEDRVQYIRAKYVDKRFVIPTCQNEDSRQEALMSALHNRHLHGIVQLFAEGVDLAAPLAQSLIDETPLHFIVRAGEDGLTMPCADFIIQNSRSVNRTDRHGNTPLHICADLNRPESMKLLLRAAAQFNLINNASETPLDVAQRKGHTRCVELLRHAESGKKELFENVDFDWSILDDELTFDSGDYSDDEGDGDVGGVGVTSGGFSRRSFRGPRNGNVVSPMSPPSTVTTLTPMKSNQNTNSHNMVSSASHYKPPLVSSQSMIVPNPVKQQGAPSVFSTFTPAPQKDSTNYHNSSQYALVPNQNDPVKTAAAAKYQAVPLKETKKSALDQDSSLKHPVSNRRSLVVDQRHLRATSDPKTLQEMVRAGSDVVPSLPPKTKYQGTHAVPSAAPNVAPKPPSLSTDSLTRVLSTPSPQYSGSGFASGVARPQPPPRKIGRSRARRCKALFDCEADHPDEISFKTGDIIQIVSDQTDDENWMEGVVESSNPVKRGLFPVSFVHMMPDT